MSDRGSHDPREPDFYDRSVHVVARDLLGCRLRHGGAAGRVVETESYHEEEPACHAYVGLTARTRILFGPPARAYVYRSYGIHALFNVVVEAEGVGAAVLIRALEPVEGAGLMESRRGRRPAEDLCSGPGKLTQALGLGLDSNGASLLGGAIEIEPARRGERSVELVAGSRIGITRATELPWRFCDATSSCVSRPWPAAMRGRSRAPNRRRAA